MPKRDVVRFNGQPVEVELVYSTGKEGSNEHGPFYTYALKGDKVMFATPALNQVIQNLKPSKGMRLSIQLGAGNRWDVHPLNPPAGQPEDMPASATRQTAQAIQQGNGTPAAPAPAIPVNGQGWTALRMALFSAIDDAAEAEKYASGKGMSIRFSAEDLRAMANTGVIGMQERR